MGLFIDSAKIEEVRQAIGLGFVLGVTTNPTIMAQTGASPKTVISAICATTDGPVFYQLTTKSPKEREREGRDIAALGKQDQVVLKIPATTDNMALIELLSNDIPCAATAVYSAAQALAANEAGADYVIPYVNRATRLLGDGLKLVREISQVLDCFEESAAILAASIKSPEEAIAAVVAGADDLTMPLDILRQLGNHPLSDQAIAEFDRAGA
jgi:transaldolase